MYAERMSGPADAGSPHGGIKILDLEITRATACEQDTACALLTLQLHKQYDMDQLPGDFGLPRRDVR